MSTTDHEHTLLLRLLRLLHRRLLALALLARRGRLAHGPLRRGCGGGGLMCAIVDIVVRRRLLEQGSDGSVVVEDARGQRRLRGGNRRADAWQLGRFLNERRQTAKLNCVRAILQQAREHFASALRCACVRRR